jgi:hypothetical protein
MPCIYVVTSNKIFKNVAYKPEHRRRLLINDEGVAVNYKCVTFGKKALKNCFRFRNGLMVKIASKGAHLFSDTRVC